MGNTLSTRLDIKKLNRETENKLALTDGTLTALYSRTNAGYTRLDSPAIMRFAWKLLIQNHAHDSICCCSSDETMQDVQHRLRNAFELAREVEKDSLFKLGAAVAPGPSKGAILVYNPLPFARSERIRAQVAVPCALDSIGLTDADGRPVPGAVTERRFLKRRDIETLKANEFAELEADTTRVLMGGEEETDVYTGLLVDFLAEDIPACGYRCYYFGRIASEAPRPAARPLESDYLRVDIQTDGTLDILYKKSGRVLKRTHYFEIIPDDGDTYTFSPAGPPIQTKECSAQVEYLNEGAAIHWQMYTTRGDVHIQSLVTLSEGGRMVCFDTKVENRAKGIRLRVVFSYPGRAACSMGDTAFDLTRRPVYDAADLTAENIVTYPMRDISALWMPWGREAVFCDATHEYEAVNRDGNAFLALTLLRAVGKVYATQTLTKSEIECGSGVRWWTADAQMQGVYHIRYALRSYEGDPGSATLLNDAAAFTLPLIAWGIYAEGDAPPVSQGCEVEGAVLTSMECGGDSSVWLRIHNPEHKPVKATVRFGCALRQAWLMSMAGKEEGVLPCGGGKLAVDLPAHKIATIKVVLEQAGQC